MILVDDANRISGFQHIVQLLQSKRESQSIKIIATVRDYAKDKIESLCKTVDYFSQEIKAFTDEQIKKFLEQEF